MSRERYIIETLFRIPNKYGREVDFKLNPAQVVLDDNVSPRNISPKSRQLGESSYITARFLAKCLDISQPNRRCVVVSHSTDATQKLLDKTDFFLTHLKGGVPADLKYNTRHELMFNKTGSTFYMGTAGYEFVGVGDTVTDLHLSEAAQYPDMKAILKGVVQAVPIDGEIWVESTGNGMGNWFHRTCLRAAAGESQYRLHFLPWTLDLDYRLPLSDAEAFALLESLDDEEKRLHDGGLSAEQLAFRRWKIRDDMEGDDGMFREQYPLTLDECFQGRGGSIFNRVLYVPSDEWRKHPTIAHLSVFGGHPRTGQNYLVGVDVGGGTGGDATVAEIFSLEEMRQVGEWVWNRMEPHVAAAAHIEVFNLFNKPYVNAERNNHGILYLKELAQHYDGTIHMSRPPSGKELEYGKIADFGTYVTRGNRTHVIDSFRQYVAEDITIHSPVLKAEMDSFVELENGNIGAQEGCNDDTVMAAAHATFVLPRALGRVGRPPPPQQRIDDPFSLESILSELEGRFVEAQ